VRLSAEPVSPPRGSEKLSRGAVDAELGYQARLFDEDAESMIVYAVRIDDAHSLTAHTHWDANEGTSVCFRFVDCGVQVTLAESEHPPGIVEVLQDP
jgi:hypothetical protein